MERRSEGRRNGPVLAWHGMGKGRAGGHGMGISDFAWHGMECRFVVCVLLYFILLEKDERDRDKGN